MAIFGAAWAGLYWFSTDMLAQWLSERSVRKLYLKGKKPEAMELAGKIVAQKSYRPVIMAWLALMIPTVPIFATFVPLSASPFIYGGFALGVGTLTLAVGKKWIRNFRVGSARRILRFLIGKGKREEIDQLLAHTYQQEFLQLQKVAVEQMGNWGSPLSVKLLEKASQSSNPEMAALGLHHLQEVTRRLNAARPYSVAGLPTLFNEFEHLTLEAEEHAAVPDQVERFLAKRDEVRQRIEEIIASQMHLRTSFPDLFCMECLTRAEELTHRDWRYVRCKTCQSPENLARGIAEVVGCVGPEEESTLKDGVYQLQMWNPQDEKATPGEVDRIAIQAGASYNYDWAVSAVVESMSNRFPNQKLQLRIDVAPEIRLQTNTLAILREIQATQNPAPRQ